MEQLFAPWRIEWVKREDRGDRIDCVFCELPKRGEDREELLVARSERAYALLNNYPYNPGHALVIPKRHIEELRDLTSDELLVLGRLTQRTIDAIDTAMEPDGFNVGLNIGRAGGGSIDHLHTHVVPRWTGDTNFMAVLDETKLIVQALADTYVEVHDAFADQSDASSREGHEAVWLDLC